MIDYSVRKISIDDYNKNKEKIVILLMDVFLACETPDYTQEGIDTFSAYVNDENIMRNLDMYGAFIDNEIIGVLAARNEGKHISLFFVDSKYQRQGVGKRLFSTFARHISAKSITVNSSSYAVDIYRKLGFSQTDAEQTQNGIKYTRMEYKS